jgi:hypothetical protein
MAAVDKTNIPDEPAQAKSVSDLKPTSDRIKAPAVKSIGAESAEFCVYIGPGIHGHVQSGMVMKGSRSDAETCLAKAIEKYPLIAKLIVTDRTFLEDRVKVKTEGNALNVYYKKLANSLL